MCKFDETTILYVEVLFCKFVVRYLQNQTNHSFTIKNQIFRFETIVNDVNLFSVSVNNW